MRKSLFIFSSIISTIIDYAILFLILFLCKIRFYLCLIIVGTIFILMLCLVIFGITSLKNMKDKEEKYPPFMDRIYQLVNRVNQENHLNIKCLCFDFHLPNPACNMGNYLFVNSSSNVGDDFIDALTAHEIGHYLSGISKLTFIASLKPICFVGKIIFYNLYVITQNRGINWLSIILKWMFAVTNLTNIIFVFPFIKEDEFIANSFAAKLGYGESLRTYYYQCIDDQFEDFQHPTARQMIERLNKNMKLKGVDLDCYYAGDKLYYAFPKTKVFFVRNGITRIGTIKSDTLIKIDAKDVMMVNHTSNLPNLMKINMPKCPISQINKFKFTSNNCHIVSLESNEIDS